MTDDCNDVETVNQVSENENTGLFLEVMVS